MPEMPSTYIGSQRWIFNNSLKTLTKNKRLLAKIYRESQERIVQKLAGYRLASEVGTALAPKEIRLQELYNQVDDEIRKLGVKTSGYIRQGFKGSYEETYYQTAFTVEREINIGKGFIDHATGYNLNYPLLPTEAAEGALTQDIAGHTFKDRMLRDRQKLQWLVRQEVAGAITEGISAKDLAKRLESLDNAYLTGEAKSMATARTEMLRAYSLGQERATDEAIQAGVQFDYKWSGTLGSKTRPSHQRADGQKAKFDENGKPYFMINGVKMTSPRLPAPDNTKPSAGEVIQCRCRRLSLPFGIEPTSRVSKIPGGGYKKEWGSLTYEEWKKGLKAA